MKKAVRIIGATILGVCGIVIVGTGVYFLLQGPDLLLGLKLGGMVLLGIALVVYGLAVALGKPMREVIESLLLGTSTQ